MKKSASSKQQSASRCLSPPGHYIDQLPAGISNPRSLTPDGKKRSDRLFHPSFGSTIFPSSIMPSTIPILPSSKSVSSHSRDASTSPKLCTSASGNPEERGSGSLESSGFCMPNGGRNTTGTTTTASCSPPEAPETATAAAGVAGMACGGGGGGGEAGRGGGNRSGFTGGNVTSTATGGGGSGGGGGAAFVQSAMGIDTAAFVSLVNTALPSLVAKGFRRRAGKDAGGAGAAGGAVAGGAFGSDGGEALGVYRSEGRINNDAPGGFRAGGVKGVYADARGLHRTGSGFTISGFPKSASASATAGGEPDRRGAAAADSSAQPGQKSALGGGGGSDGAVTSASASGLAGGAAAWGMGVSGGGGLKGGGGGDPGAGAGVTRGAGLGEELPDVAIGVLSKWVHLGRGWAPRLFILDKGVLSYCKIEGPHRASVLLEVQRRPGACLVGDEVRRLLRKEQERQRERVRERGDKGSEKERESERASAAVGGQQPVLERSVPSAAHTASAAAIGVATAAAAAAATAATAAASVASNAAASAAAAAATVLSVPSAISSATVSAFSPAVSASSSSTVAAPAAAAAAGAGVAAGGAAASAAGASADAAAGTAPAAVAGGAASVASAPSTPGAGATAAAWAGGTGAMPGGGVGGGGGGKSAITRPLCRVYGEIHLSAAKERTGRSQREAEQATLNHLQSPYSPPLSFPSPIPCFPRQAAKERTGRSQREAEQATFVADVTLEPLRACLARANVSAEVIKECEEVVRREVLQRLQLRLREEQERRQMLHERISQLEADKVELESAVVEESMYHIRDGDEQSETATTTAAVDADKGAPVLLPLADNDREDEDKEEEESGEGEEEGEDEGDDDHSSTQAGEDEFFEAMDEFVGSRRWEEMASLSLSLSSLSAPPGGSFERSPSSLSSLDMEKVGFTYPKVPRRERLPEPAEVEKAVGLWNIIKDCVGKDMSKICLPVYFNEPISTLQKCCEEMEYSWLLDRAAEYGRRGEHLMRALHVAAFAMSAYAASAEHRVQKPFNPLIGETYEADFPDKGFRFISEKVVHHPPIVAAHCEGRGWRFWGDCNIRIRFWGPSMQLEPLGVLSVAFDDGEVFEWNKVTTGIYNLIIGKLYIDHYGTMRINSNRGISVRLKLKERSFFDRDTHQVRGYAVGEKGEKLATLVGRWDESLHYVPGDLSHKEHGKAAKDDQHLMAHAHLLWRKSPPSPFPCKYTFTPYCITLNEITPDLKGVLPPTDSRLRPDQRSLEEGYFDRANAEKIRLETRQRQVGVRWDCCVGLGCGGMPDKS
ncbi:unnamed protein product [Closterium sp. NIES-53]